METEDDRVERLMQEARNLKLLADAEAGKPPGIYQGNGADISAPGSEYDPPLPSLREDDAPEVIDRELGKRPFEIAAQIKLFKSGLFGTAVTVWSSYEGGYDRTQLFYKPEEPVVVRVVDDNIEVQLAFAGAYIVGWVESLGGSMDKLKIWLEPYLGTT